MKRNALLITATLFCLATSALAADGKQNQQPQPQSSQTGQAQTPQGGVEGSKDQVSSAQSDCKVKPKKHAKQKQQQNESQSDLELWQSQLIYGGG